MNTQTNNSNSAPTSNRNVNDNDNGTALDNERQSFSIYLAGDLWTHKDLIGNALLAEYIDEVSGGRYKCVLPQDLEEPVDRTVDIRNVDLKHVMTSDMAIFNFDGANLDAGTVVEFIYAKMLDIPCVLLRTDFRSAGEGNQDQDPWNLMASHWPRSKVVKLHGMAEYQSSKGADQSIRRTLDTMYRKMSVQIIDGLDAVRAETPLVAEGSRLSTIFDWAVECPGAGYDKHLSKQDVQALIATKLAKGLLRSEKA
ncbi:MAG: nucleoside 2-deoxyribosyltransferase [Cyanobacteria bacterium REEB67]|nr:nucleoside 2-deoxyribosyltransferase [Cyanobacteria bacterium REEB67]